MDSSTAERWVVISATVVGGMYVYRRVKGNETAAPTIKGVAGKGSPAPVGSFVTAWGFLYLGLSVLAEATPGLGGALAIAVMIGALFANGPDLFGSVTKATGAVNQTAGQATAAAGSTASSGVGTAGTAASAVLGSLGGF